MADFAVPGAGYHGRVGSFPDIRLLPAGLFAFSLG